MQVGRGAVCFCILVGMLLRSAQGTRRSDVHKKWIIVTTINYPTESIRILANMTDWKVSHLFIAVTGRLLVPLLAPYDVPLLLLLAQVTMLLSHRHTVCAIGFANCSGPPCHMHHNVHYATLGMQPGGIAAAWPYPRHTTPECVLPSDLSGPHEVPDAGQPRGRLQKGLRMIRLHLPPPLIECMGACRFWSWLIARRHRTGTWTVWRS